MIADARVVILMLIAKAVEASPIDLPHRFQKPDWLSENPDAEPPFAGVHTREGKGRLGLGYWLS